MSYGWAPYIPVAKQRAKANKQMDKLRKKGIDIQPIDKTGNKISKTFWGKAWCTQLESFSDFDNRLPRGRTYVRNGSVCHLEIKKGQINAMVSGSKIYQVKINIKPLSKSLWQVIRSECAGGVGSMLELLQGKIADNVMKAVTNTKRGLFPQAEEIEMHCDCPDWATMCKHIAAVLYGVGARLDHSPDLLFLLRDVDQMDLIDSEVKIPSHSPRKPRLSGDLSDIFGIDLELPTAKKSKARTVTGAELISNTTKNQSLKISTKPSAVAHVKTATKQAINISKGIRAFHIKKLRKALNMTKAEFAKSVGKNVATIISWESKKGVLNLQTASREALEKAFKAHCSEVKS